MSTRIASAAGAAMLLALALTGCTAAGGADARAHAARLTIQVAPRSAPERVEVRLASPRSAYRAVHLVAAGSSRSFDVPAGWVTVRVPGLCVVPTTASSAGTTVEVGSRDCTVR